MLPFELPKLTVFPVILSHREPRHSHREVDIDITEREYRQRTQPDYAEDFDRDHSSDPSRRTRIDQIKEQGHSTVDPPHHHHHHDSMGYYDAEGEYHSFRHGIEKAADRVLHPEYPRSTVREEIHVSSEDSHRHHEHHHRHHDTEGTRPSSSRHSNTITIPCHHIRMGDLVMLQGRPCQVIRITTSAHTGQHRYLGVDLFTKQLHEESSFVSHPSPSVVVQNMLGPVFKQYRVLDIRDDGRVVAMTETGDVKQGLPVIDQGGLWSRLNDVFASGRGSIRVLVINDRGKELAVDYKVVHGSRL